MAVRQRVTTAFLLVVCAALCIHGLGNSQDKVLLKDVSAITLHAGSMTTGRRSSPVPQLAYKGSLHLAKYCPTTIQCHNRGHDGYDVQWECVASDLPVEVKFGKINVGCEGYDYPHDPYVLRGSCGLEYTLKSTGAGGHNSNKNYGYNQQGFNSFHRNEESSFSDVFVLLLIGGVIYLIYSKCLDPPPPRRNSQSHQSTQQGEPADDPDSSQTRTETNAGTDQSGLGFWSGAALAGIAGYLFGRGNRGTYYNRNQDWGWRNESRWLDGGGFGGGWGGGSRRATGFGGTSRR